ncbi:TIGR02680 family protein [Nocardia sp. NPDC058497]|uniref:TIGR02680 family protein n=1 Tax=Nocardia sp. NPDC058497 TaxID=3346529 RepID=UPI00365FE9F9
MTTTTVLPVPTAQRWKPLRAGLIDLFYYDEQEFRFRDGRLLLRGNNGAGKSKVLALLMPFLLDGDLAPHRVEPDGDSRKRMEWNLLLGGAHPHSERIGYTWMEFGRVDEDGVARFTTIGCGLKAVKGRGIAAHWYFVSSARVGDQLRLVGDQGYPVSRDRLGEQLTGLGERYDTATAYRRAVDESLFGLGELRYAALVDLLIRLRQPQLSKKPSEKVLAQALTESLQPLDQAILADVAEAFRSLQEDRDELAEMSAALTGTETFLRQYREYARVAGRRQTTRLRHAHSRYEQVGRDLGEAKAALEQAGATETRLRAEQLTASDEAERLGAHRQSLHDSAAADAARELEQARDTAEQAARLASDRADDRADAERAADQTAARLLAAETALDSADSAFATACEQARHHAARAALSAGHTREVIGELDRIRTVTTDADPLALVRRNAERLTTGHTDALKRMRTMIALAETAARELATAKAQVDKLDAELAAVADQATAADAQIRAEAEQHTAAVSEYLHSTIELVLDDVTAVLDELGAWSLSPTGESPLVAAVTVRAAALGDELTHAAADLQAARTAAAEARRELEVELSRLRRGGIEYPPVRHTRSAPVAQTPGAPLWQLITFIDEVGEDERAGLEAALEAAGILDAWLHPDGVLRASAGQVIVAGTTPAPGPSLAACATADIDRTDPGAAALDPAAVTAVLAAIGVGADSSHHTWVDGAGRFRVGVLHGAWHKPAAQYIGATARERFRLERIGVLEAEIATRTVEFDRLGAKLEQTQDRRRVLRHEAAELPADTGVQDAHRAAAALAVRRRALTADHAAAIAATAVAETRAQEAAADRDRDAADVGLPTNQHELDGIADALADYRVSLGAIWSATERVRDAAQRRAQAAGDDDSARERLLARAEAAEAARLDALRAGERFTTLNANVGAEVAQLQAQLRQSTVDLAANKDLQRRLVRELEQALRDLGVAEGKLTELTGQLESVRAARDELIGAVQRFAATGLFGVALPDIDVPDGESWSAATAIGFARAVEAAVVEVAEDDKTLARVQRRVAEEHKTLADLLSGQGNSTSMTLFDDAIVADVVFRGKPATVPELAATLRTEVDDRERLLTEREREVLENHLVDEVASALQELILGAEAQVARMNTELESRPTSTGMRLRLSWVPSADAPIGAAAALAQLRRTADVWNDADRAAVGAFLQQEIERIRTANGVGTWLEHLTTAFDYRRWNTFVIELQQRGLWRSATGPASGGERVLAASVPLFAAASAHYGSATNPHAPRMVMLDEAFAGVDDNARAKYLGLLAAFDLDVVMTSEREWGCYPEVPGLAIAQLARTDDIDAVLVTPWEWDGIERRPMQYAAPVPASVAPPPAEESLF